MRARTQSALPGATQRSAPLHLQGGHGGSVYHRDCPGAAVSCRAVRVAWCRWVGVCGVYRIERCDPHQVHQLYSWRFGIESGYRQRHHVRARTTSRHPGLHLLFVGLAWLILNCYMAFRQVWLTIRHAERGHRVYKVWLTLQRLARLLVRVIEQLLGTPPMHQVAHSKIELDPIS